MAQQVADRVSNPRKTGTGHSSAGRGNDADSVLAMAVWVSLLRGVNLGARNKVNMPRLRVALAEAGFDDVRTLVQSGNVIARSRHRSPEKVAKTVHEVIREHFDLEVPVTVRTPGQLREVLDWCPFPAESAREPPATGALSRHWSR